jgi:CubicO group peptidase (beta-lactamase class C family)
MKKAVNILWFVVVIVSAAALVMICAVFSGCAKDTVESYNGSGAVDASTEDNIFAILMERFAEEDAFSGTVLIADGDTVVFEYACGMADKDLNKPNNIDTKFNIGSVAKMFTAVAIAQLAEQGKLSFSDTIDQYVSGFPGEIAHKITIGQLLTHTSGLGDIFTPEYIAKKDEVENVDGFMAFVRNELPRFEPGSRHAYSNAGFIVLGAVIEKVSGEDYYDYIRSHITEPLGMADTAFYRKVDDVPNLARGYTRGMAERSGVSAELSTRDENAAREDNINFLPLVGSPSGGAYSTARDLLKFSTALRNYSLLSKKYTDLITTGNVSTPFGKYGYGFEDLIENGRRAIGHSGGAPGINALFRILGDDDYTVIILSNYDNGMRMPYSEIIWSLILVTMISSR